MDNNVIKAVNTLKKNICNVWDSTKSENIFEKKNIRRGHMRIISSDVEDKIAIFISEILGDEFDIYIDPTISIVEKETNKKKSHRPDILILKNKIVVALIEIKTNMGFCRKLNPEGKDDGVIEKLNKMHNKFLNEKEIECKFSEYDDEGNKKEEDPIPIVVKYDENVLLFLVALTTENGLNDNKIKDNKDYATDNNVLHYLLFDGWYGSLKPRDDLDSFKDDLLKIKKRIEDNS